LRRSDLKLSLKVRIVAVLSGVLTFGAVVLGLAAWRSASVAAQQAYDRLLSGGVVQIAENIYVQGGVVTVEPPVSVIASLSAYDLVFYKVVDPRGVAVAGYGDLSSAIDPAEARSGVVLEDGVYQGQPVRIASLARQVATPNGEAWATVVLAQTLASRQALTRNLTLQALLLIAALSVAAVLATALAIGPALKPLTRIEREIAQRRPDDLRPLAGEPPVEIRSLVQAIDGFMARLSHRMTGMQRFIADAAHQIRTPLAALDAQVEILRADPASPRREDVLARIRDRTTELGRLTSQLLDHAMVIHRMEFAPHGLIELNALAKSVMAKAVPLSLPREVDIGFLPATSDVVIEGDPVSLAEAVANLIDNALKHGARTRMNVSVGTDDAAAWIEVADDGAGFSGPEADLVRPFSKGPQSHGSGLGLAIANDVGRAHNGRLSLTRDGDMTKVRLTFPV
jgi:two-component system sensor histidine kinase TctE